MWRLVIVVGIVTVLPLERNLASDVGVHAPVVRRRKRVLSHCIDLVRGHRQYLLGAGHPFGEEGRDGRGVSGLRVAVASVAVEAGP
jgi:hypothetical protein